MPEVKNKCFSKKLNLVQGKQSHENINQNKNLIPEVKNNTSERNPVENNALKNALRVTHISIKSRSRKIAQIPSHLQAV